MNAEVIAGNIALVQAKIAQACAVHGNSPDDVMLIAVSKQKPVSDIVAAAQAGLRYFGENRIEEMQTKRDAVMSRVQSEVIWHMIGAIPPNKARYIPRLFDMFEAVDTPKLARKLSELIVAGGLPPFPVLVEINISGEETKGGLEAVNWATDKTVFERVLASMREVCALPGLHVQGLMTLAPYLDDPEDTRPVFKGLYALRGALQDALGVSLPHLSMGMTNDYPVAIEEGATIVRVGRAIFGERG